MKKTLQIVKTNDDFEIKEDEKTIITIEGHDLSLSGEDVFFKIFDKFPIDDPEVKLDINIDDSVRDSNDVRLLKEIKDVLCDIASKIEQSKQETNKNSL